MYCFDDNVPVICRNADLATEVITRVYSLDSHDDPGTTLSETEWTLAIVGDVTTSGRSQRYKCTSLFN